MPNISQINGFGINAQTASLATTASFVTGSIFAGTNLARSASFALTASYLNTLNQDLIFNGNLTLNGTASITFLNVTYESASVIYSSGSNQFGDSTLDTQTLIGTVIVSGGLHVTGSASIPNITGSLFGTSSWAFNAISSSYALNSTQAQTADTASNILGGKAPHIPFFITDTSLATSSLYQSGSGTVIINLDNATTANPEALFVWQPNNTSINVISGKGNLNNYLQLNIQNTNQGTDASSDVVATANNGSEVDNYIDMGINSENYTGFLGGPNDAYLYAHSHDLWIGNINDGYKVYFFNSSSENPVVTITPENNVEITGSLYVTVNVIAPSFTGSLKGSASYAETASYSTTLGASLSQPATDQVRLLSSNGGTLSTVTINNVTSASHAQNADSALTANYATTAGNGGVTQIIAGSGITLLPPTGLGAVTIVASAGGGVTIISGSLVTGSFTNVTSYTFNHNLNTRTPIITVFDSNYNQIIPENIQLVDTASAIITFPTQESGFAIGSTGGTTGTALSSSYALFSTYADTASFFAETDPVFVAKSGSFATTSSNVFKGNQTISGSVFLTGSVGIVGNQIITGSLTVSGSGTFTNIGPAIFNGSATITGSFNVSGSTTQTGNNTLIGNTTLSGSINVSGSSNFHNSEFIVTGSTSILGNFNVKGTSVFSDTTFTVTGSQYLTGSSFINGNQNLTGNSTITGSLNVIGDINVVSGSSFTRWGNKLFNYGAFSDYTTQSGSADTAHAVKFNTTDVALGISLSGSSAMVIENTGIYNFQWSGQLSEGAGATVVSIWIKVNGNDVVGSRGDVTLASNSNALPAWNYVLPFNANDAIELYWSSTGANTTWEFSPVEINPPRPSTASVIATITQIA